MFDFIHFAETAVAAAGEAAQEKESVTALLGLNWKLFIAQLVNFGVIIFVLWKWVFTPVTNALSSRTKKIEQSLADAEKIKQQVADLEIYTRDQEAKARAEYQKAVDESVRAASRQKENILGEARVQSEKMIADAEARIAQEHDRMIKEAREELADLVIAAAEKLLSEKIDRTKDMEFTRASLEQLAGKKI